MKKDFYFYYFISPREILHLEDVSKSKLATNDIKYGALKIKREEVEKYLNNPDMIKTLGGLIMKKVFDYIIEFRK